MTIKKKECDYGIKYIYNTEQERMRLVLEITSNGKNAFIHETIELKELYVLNENAIWNDGKPYIDQDYDKKRLKLEKATQIKINDKNCSDEINKLLGVVSKDEAIIKQLNMLTAQVSKVIKQLNMLTAQVSKVEGADEELKDFDFENQKTGLLAYNRKLKEKINNATTMEEIRQYVFNIKEIEQEIETVKCIETLK